MSILLVVYGTLKKGFGNHRFLMQTAEYVGDFESEPKYTMLHLGGFPGVVPFGNNKFKGEVYRIENDKVVEALDRFEGHPHLFKRTIIDTKYGTAYFYEYQGADKSELARWEERNKVISSGVWQ